MGYNAVETGKDRVIIIIIIIISIIVITYLPYSLSPLLAHSLASLLTCLLTYLLQLGFHSGSSPYTSTDRTNKNKYT